MSDAIQQEPLHARIQIWFNETDWRWDYRVDLDGSRDGSNAFTKWGARRAAERMARRMARSQHLRWDHSEDYTIEVTS